MATVKYINVSLELFGVVLSLVIILSLIFTGYEKDQLNRKFIRVLVGNILVLFSDMAAWLFKGNTDPLNCVIVPIANFSVFFLGYLLMALFTDYLAAYISEKTDISRTLVRIAWGISGIAMILVIISQFNNMYYLIDSNNMYQRQEWFWLSQIWGILGMAINAILLFQVRKVLDARELFSLNSYIVFPAAAMIIQMFLYGIALLYLGTSLSIVCIYMNAQIEQAKRFRERELELEKSRIEIMLSQIQPHFLLNSLASIRHLCHTDPQRAEKVIVDFSEFLRGNLQSLSTAKLIPFRQELFHLKSYLEIERIRYEDRLRVVYDIQCEDFALPSLTLQPIVENAVRYGIGGKTEGGTVTVSVREEGENIVIVIADDGAGFDVNDQWESGRPHIGTANVGKRLQYQCNGSLHINSTPGSGTTAVIIIPRDKADLADT